MKLAIFNGSPRGKGSNTRILLEHFQIGFENRGGEVSSIDYLIQEKYPEDQVQHFKDAESILLAFPLYVDSVPGIVKKFVETLGSFNGNGKKILFLVQSGFPEAVHSEEVKSYLLLLSKRLNLKCLGVIIKPGVEGIKIMPEWMTGKLFNKMKLFGEQLATNGKIDEKSVKKLACPYKFSVFKILFFRLMRLTGMANFYWNKNLKEHGAFEKRFDAPYLEN